MWGTLSKAPMFFQFLATGNVILKASARSFSPAERQCLRGRERHADAETVMLLL